jgi:hypothetical protein
MDAIILACVLVIMAIAIVRVIAYRLSPYYRIDKFSGNI